MKNYIKEIMFLVAIIFMLPSTGYASQKDEKLKISIESNITRQGYVGQVFEYTVILRSNDPNIGDVRVLEAPEFPENTKVIKGITRSSRPEEETIKGERFYKWTIEREFIIPSAPGKYEVKAGRYLVFIGKQRIVNDFFWGNRRVMDYEEMTVEGKNTSFKVDKLPEKGKPADFSGCVGDFSIEGWFPPGEIMLGKEAIVVFSISGFGNLSELKFTNLANIFTNGCSLREIEQDEKVTQKEGKLFSEVTLTCRFVPQEEDGSISPIVINFYNPYNKRYENVSSYPLHWDSKERKRTKEKVEAVEI